MAICAICGSKFDERTYQVVVPTLEGSFDHVDCAELALARSLRETSRSTLAEALAAEVELLRARLAELSPRG